MKDRKTLIFCIVLCIALLSACFSPWDGSDEGVPLKYTVVLIGSNGIPIIVESTYVRPIVISVPEGTWDIVVRVDAEEDDDFAETRQRFLGRKKIDHDKEENIILDTDINNMSPAIQVKRWDQLSKAFNGEWDKFLNKSGWKPNGNPQKYFVELLDNTSTDATTSAILDGDSNKNIVLWVEDKDKKATIKRADNLKTPLFQVKKGTLTLGGYGEGKIIIDGDKNNNSNSNDSLITVLGTLIMNKGVTLKDNKKSANYGYKDNLGGAGVYVDQTGTFIMNDGTISGNEVVKVSGSEAHGGGVRVYGGTFYMHGGTISGNTADVGGGVRVTGNGGIFIMAGGTISGNTASASGGGVSVNDVSGTTFSKTGGSITSDNVPDQVSNYH
jgi:hypothetical protein